MLARIAGAANEPVSQSDNYSPIDFVRRDAPCYLAVLARLQPRGIIVMPLTALGGEGGGHRTSIGIGQYAGKQAWVSSG